MEQPDLETPATVRVEDQGDAFVPRPSDSFVATPQVQRVSERALAYMDAGYPAHLTGVAGTGKTSLAFHVAARLGQPAVLLHGDDEFARSDLVGSEVGYRKSKVVDNFIRSVLKTSEQVRKMWADNRLAKACREGYTLIYDEFTRSPPEANNVLLSILEERILNLPTRSDKGEGYIRVHPDFKAIFTSNTEEYAGTHRTQNALLDRLVTIELDHPSRAAMVEITTARSGADEETVERIVDLVRAVRDADLHEHGPSVRAAIALSRVCVRTGQEVDPSERFFRDICVDILRPSRATIRGEVESVREEIESIVERVLQ